MPELPEVESVAGAMRRKLLGRPCTGLYVRFPGVFEPSAAAVKRTVVGRELVAIERHGKYLVLKFDDSERAPGRVMLHLRMTGQVFVQDDYQPDHHVHATFDFAGQTVHYRDIRKFGRWKVVGEDWRQRELAHVGPDMLEIRFAAWYERVQGRRAPLKAVLLDQGLAAGLGNIYADETLSRAGIHPLMRPTDLGREDLKRVLREAKTVLRHAIRHGGTTFLNFTDFDGRPGNFRRRLRVYGRRGEACDSCGTLIEKLTIGGRSTCFCPSCQPGPHVDR